MPSQLPFRSFLTSLSRPSVRRRRRVRKAERSYSTVEAVEERLLLTSTTADVFFYSLAAPGELENSDGSTLSVDDSDIVKLTVFSTNTWAHEIYFDGSDVGLASSNEDIDGLSVRDDGSFLISTKGNAKVPGATAKGGDLMVFTPSSLGEETTGVWDVYFDGSDVGLKNAAKIDGVSELSDGTLLLSLKANGSLEEIPNFKDEDVVAFTPSKTGSQTSGSWERWFDGSDANLKGTEDVAGLSVDPNGTTLHLTTNASATVASLTPAASDVFTFEMTASGGKTEGRYRGPMTLTGQDVGLSSDASIDAFHQTTEVVDSVVGRTLRAGESLADIFYYSLNTPADVENSDGSTLRIDDSDVVRLTVYSDEMWTHEIFFDGSDVGLASGGEDIE
ncbi:MAG: hypothetical protein AB8G99_16695, partial [Planctomycetaceae bacterium]